jgi:hypothetical protein
LAPNYGFSTRAHSPENGPRIRPILSRPTFATAVGLARFSGTMESCFARAKTAVSITGTALLSTRLSSWTVTSTRKNHVRRLIRYGRPAWWRHIRTATSVRLRSLTGVCLFPPVLYVTNFEQHQLLRHHSHQPVTEIPHSQAAATTALVAWCRALISRTRSI